jgi:hypothetical protein
MRSGSPIQLPQRNEAELPALMCSGGPIQLPQKTEAELPA